MEKTLKEKRCELIKELKEIRVEMQSEIHPEREFGNLDDRFRRFRNICIRIAIIALQEYDIEIEEEINRIFRG